MFKKKLINKNNLFYRYIENLNPTTSLKKLA